MLVLVWIVVANLPLRCWWCWLLLVLLLISLVVHLLLLLFVPRVYTPFKSRHTRTDIEGLTGQCKAASSAIKHESHIETEASTVCTVAYTHWTWPTLFQGCRQTHSTHVTPPYMWATRWDGCPFALEGLRQSPAALRSQGRWNLELSLLGTQAPGHTTARHHAHIHSPSPNHRRTFQASLWLLATSTGPC